MGKLKKPGQTGVAVTYIPRTRAIRKLQITLPEFRRLCIFKGISPQIPHKKLKQKNRVYYSVKDVKYMLNEPLIDKFRDFKALSKKKGKRRAKKEFKWANEIDRKMRLSKYKLDRIVKERYPTFMDALRDLDDALCSVSLFAYSSVKKPVSADDQLECQRLMREWEYYVIKTHSLKKTFLSIKGIYYQAEIRSVPVTWLVPFTHLNTNTLPYKEVDMKILASFLEVHTTLMRFVNYRLYDKETNLKYPPQFLSHKGDYGESLYYIDDMQEMGQKLPVLQPKANATATSNEEPGDSEIDSNTGSGDKKEGVVREEIDEISEIRKDLGIDDAEEARLVFQGKKVFINRECPIHSLDFVLRCGGAVVGMDSPLSPFKMDAESIEYHIADRNVEKRYLGRIYVQPQWVYDCMNCNRLLPPAQYALNEKLPPHLSPFVDAEDHYYIPKRATELYPMRYSDGADGGKTEKLKENDELEMIKPLLTGREAKAMGSVAKRNREKLKEADTLRKRRKKAENNK